MEPTIQIPESEYKRLLKEHRLLIALRSAGVDNWDGWDTAMDMLNGEDEGE